LIILEFGFWNWGSFYFIVSPIPFARQTIDRPHPEPMEIKNPNFKIKKINTEIQAINQ